MVSERQIRRQEFKIRTCYTGLILAIAEQLLRRISQDDVINPLVVDDSFQQEAWFAADAVGVLRRKLWGIVTSQQRNQHVYGLQRDVLPTDQDRHIDEQATEITEDLCNRVFSIARDAYTEVQS